MEALGVGITLRNERVRRQISLEEIARETKIPVRSLEAIEAEDFAMLPGIVFTRSFVRQYALALGLDERALLEKLPRFDLDTAPLPEPPSSPRLPLWDPRWNSALASCSWVLVALAAGTAGYLHFKTPSKSVFAHGKTAAKISPTPEPAPAASSPETAPSAAGFRPVEVRLNASADSWVEITADGKNVFAGTLRAGGTQAISADKLVTILAGNAGGVQVSLNGKTLDSLGPLGEARTVRLTAGGPLSDPKNLQPLPDPL